MIRSKARSKSLKNIVLSVLTAVICFNGSAFAAGSSDELLSLIPADSLFAVRLNNFDYTLNQLDAYLAGVSPIPMGLSMMARMQFAQLLGSPELKGINTAGSFAAYGVAKPGQSEPVIKVLVPVSNYDEFVSGNPNVTEPDASGISKVGSNGMVLAIVKKAGNYALFAEADDTTSSTVTKGLETSLDLAEKTLATKQPIWAYANIQKIGEIYGETAIAELEKSKTMVADMKANIETAVAELEKQKAALDANDPNQQAAIEQYDMQIAAQKEILINITSNQKMTNFGEAIDMYIRIVKMLLSQSKSFSISIEPKADLLTILDTYTAMPGSEVAGILIADTSSNKADKLINYLQDGALMNFAGRLNKPLLRKIYGESNLLIAMMTGGKMTDEDIAKMKIMTNDIIDSLGSAVAVSFWADETASPPFMEDCIIEISDADKFHNATVKAIEFWNTSGITDFYKKMGMDMNFVTKMNMYEYKDAKVNSAKLILKASDPNSPEAQILDKMYGDGFEYRWSVVDGLCVEAIAGDVDAAVKELIDEVKAGGATVSATEIKQASTLLGNGADDLFGTFNIIRSIKMISAVQPAFPIKIADFQSKSNIAFGGQINNGKALLKVAVPKAHVSEVMTVIMPQPVMAQPVAQ